MDVLVACSECRAGTDYGGSRTYYFGVNLREKVVQNGSLVEVVRQERYQKSTKAAD